MSMFDGLDISGPKNWWEKTTSGIGNFLGDVIRAKGVADTGIGAGMNYVPPGRSQTVGQISGRSPAVDAAYERQMGQVADLGGRDTLQGLIRGEMGRQDALTQPVAQDPNMLGMSPEEMMAFLLGGSGGGGVDLSGYNSLLSDIAAREASVGGRYEENLAGIGSLYESAAAARERDKAALDASIEAQILADTERQTSEQASRRSAEAERFATASDARAALGADVGTSDLVGQTVEGALGRQAERALAGQQDVRTNQAIGQQQLQAELSGYTSAEQLAGRALSNNYEDRLAQLASERASIQAQMAQARASARPSGPSASEKIGALSFIQDLYGGSEPEMPELPGLGGVFQQFAPVYGNDPVAAEIAANFPSIANSVYSVFAETGDLLNPIQLAASIVEANPQYAPYQQLILALAQESGT